jgi:biopolymer transport protein ExbB/TolQ
VAAFLVGLPLAALALGLIHFGPLRHTVAFRYVEHPVEWVEVALFCCALGALGAKLWRARREAEACHAPALPRWDGKPVPVEEAVGLLAAARKMPRGLRDTYLGRRLTAVLEFLCQRRSAADLDDQLRALADNDALALEGSYALTRFITWAIPILGFLGTVLGITGAIAGVSPEKLAQDISQVTDGLAEAFDCTALALALTMITMFFSSLVERQEQALLESVDHQVERQLAHRFQRAGTVAEPFVLAVQQNTQALMAALDQVVQRQARVWADTLAEPERRAAESYTRHQEQLSAALAGAMEQTLRVHAERLAALERHSAEATAGLLQQVGALASAVRDTAREQQAALVRVAEGVAAQAAVLGRLQENENNLIHLQAVLHQNLAALASASNFEQAVHSLTAAAHLLTARAAGSAPAGHPAVHLPRQSNGKAA